MRDIYQALCKKTKMESCFPLSEDSFLLTIITVCKEVI